MSTLPAGAITRGQWEARAANFFPSRLMPAERPGVELHHSVGTYGAGSAESWMRSMQRDHLSRPNYADVWYSFGIWLDGTPIEGRGPSHRSSPTDHLTVCLAGNYDNRDLTPAQIDTIQSIRAWLHNQGGGLDLTYHAARSRVGCPGRNVIAWIATAPDPTTHSEDEMTIMRGATGRYVKVYQEALVNEAKVAKRGNPLPEYGPDEIFGRETEEAVRIYQRAAQLPVTGEIDWVTGDMLGRYVTVDT